MTDPVPEHLKQGVIAYRGGDFARALRLLKPYADRGDAGASMAMAIMYANGEGVPQDQGQAAMFYRRAAEKGLAAAQFNLALEYHYGGGVEKDAAEGVRWLRKAAEQGHPAAQARLGMLYSAGQGVAQNNEEALKWLRAAAEKNDAMAQFGLGYIYRKGLGVPPDDVEAVKWFRRSAEQGFGAAQNNLGFMYRKGIGVPQDFTEAAQWYALAAQSGEADASFIHDLMQKSDRLFPLMGKISPGDRSILLAIYQMPEEEGKAASIMTAPGSPNHALWSEMEKLGWMREAPLAELPKELAAKMGFRFSMTPLGYENIKEFLRLA
jgi:TPR repeat protein